MFRHVYSSHIRNVCFTCAPNPLLPMVDCVFMTLKTHQLTSILVLKIDCNWQTNSIYHFHINCNRHDAVTGLRTYVNAIRFAKNPHKFIINKSILAHSLKLVMLMFWILWLIINYNTNENPYLLLFHVWFVFNHNRIRIEKQLLLSNYSRKRGILTIKPLIEIPNILYGWQQ